MQSEIVRFISSCPTCIMPKTRMLPVSKLVPPPLPIHLWTHVFVDLITDLPESQGYTVILVIIDRFSKFLQLIPFPELPTTFQTAKMLFEHVFILQDPGKVLSQPDEVTLDRRPLLPAEESLKCKPPSTAEETGHPFGLWRHWVGAGCWVGQLWKLFRVLSPSSKNFTACFLPLDNLMEPLEHLTKVHRIAQTWMIH